MKAKRLKELLENIDDNTEVFIRNSVNACGNIQELIQLEQSTYGFFGTSLPCLILNTDSAKKTLEFDDDGDLIDFINSKVKK